MSSSLSVQGFNDLSKGQKAAVIGTAATATGAAALTATAAIKGGKIEGMADAKLLAKTKEGYKLFGKAIQKGANVSWGFVSEKATKTGKSIADFSTKTFDKVKSLFQKSK